jgi:serine/threonine-protein kinase
VGEQERLGRYVLLERIARGGMAEVFLARREDDELLDKRVVIKRMHEHLADDEKFVQMFLREARIAARMSHPNIVQLFEIGQEEDERFIAMEHLEGLTLHQLSRRAWAAGRALPLELVVRAIRDAALGLHYAHTLTEDGQPSGLVHRDVTLDNLFLTTSGETKLLDFGIAMGAFSDRLTQTGEIRGKVRYMSPEQVRGEDVDARTDLWSLGVCLYRLVTGHAPFGGADDVAAMTAVVDREATPASELNPHVRGPIDELLEGLLTKDRAARLADAETIYEKLSDLDGGGEGRTASVAFLKRVVEAPARSVARDLPAWASVTQPASIPALLLTDDPFDDTDAETATLANPAAPGATAPDTEHVTASTLGGAEFDEATVVATGDAATFDEEMKTAMVSEPDFGEDTMLGDGEESDPPPVARVVDPSLPDPTQKHTPSPGDSMREERNRVLFVGVAVLVLFVSIVLGVLVARDDGDDGEPATGGDESWEIEPESE